MRSSQTVVAEQAVYSASNLAFTLTLAYSLDDAVGFGQFAVGYTIHLIALNLSRARTGEVLVARTWDGADNEDVADRIRSAMALALVVGTLTAVVILGLGAVLDVDFVLLVILALATPVVLVHDVARFGSYAARTAGRALVSGVAWVGALAFPVGSLLIGQDVGATGVAIAWFVGALLAALILVGPVFRPDSARMGLRMWMHASRQPGRTYTAEFLVGRGVIEVTTLLTAYFMTADVPGTLRLVQTLFGPLGILVAGFQAALVAELAAGRRQARSAVMVGLVMLGLPILYLVGLRVTEPLIEGLLRASWPGVDDLLEIVTVRRVALIGAFAPVVILRATRSLKSALRARMVGGAFSALGAVVGVAWGSVEGLMTMLTVASAAAAAVWWWELRRVGTTVPRSSEG